MTDSLNLDVVWTDEAERLFLQINSKAVLGTDRRDALLEMIENLSVDAEAAIHGWAPDSQSGYIHEHIGRSGVIYRPGGAGGGGTYERIVGVRRGTSRHPLYVHNGTANIYGQQLDNMLGDGSQQLGGASLQGRIYPRGSAKRFTSISRAGRQGVDAATAWARQQRTPVLTFQKKGEGRRFRQWVTGQRAQPFVYYAFQTAVIYNPIMSKPAMQMVLRKLFRPNRSL